MTSFLAGLALIIVGLVSALFGYRLFRVLLPLYGAVFGFVTAWGWWGDSAWLLALIAGVVFAAILAILAYGIWSAFITVAGVVAGLALAGLIATSLNLGTWLSIALGVVLAGAFGYLFFKVRNPAVILITATVGAAEVARGVGEWFGLQGGFGTAVGNNPGWLLILLAAIFVIVGGFGLAFQWNRYRGLNLYADPVASKEPAPAAVATRAAPATVAPGASAVPAGAAGGVAAPAAVAAAVAVAAADKPVEPEPAAEAVVETPVEAPVAAVAAAEAVKEQAEEAAVEAPVEAAGEAAEAPVAAVEEAVVAAPAEAAAAVVEPPVEPVAEVTEAPVAAVEEAVVAAPAEAAAAVIEAPIAEAAVLGAAAAHIAEEAPEVEEAAPAEATEVSDSNLADAVVKEIEETYSYDDIAKFKEKLEYVEGIGPAYAEKLAAMGINTVLDLLHRGATRKGRLELAEATGISGKLILRWVNHADLYRVKGVGSEYADLLEVAGVDTVVELSKRNPANLLNAMTESNKVRKLVRQEPAASQVEDWIAQAKNLPRVIQY